MSLVIIDQISLPAHQTNEDRLGASGDLAWVIDGATDVLDSPLTNAPSDASWIARHLDDALAAHARAPSCTLEALPQRLAADTAQAFAQVARRPPVARYEHPSAAALIVQSVPGGITCLSISDCSLLISQQGTVRRFGVAEHEAADAGLASAIASHRAANATNPAETLLQRMRPSLQDMRSRMNCVNGYGVLSITPTPTSFVKHANIPLAPGAQLLLASDGFMRLVDVFHRYDAAALMREIAARGLKSMLAELRAVESADRDGATHPRIKTSDDASAILVELSA